ncbi:hypothetical protein LMG3458_04581 [Achromobacter deleyi]|uniref:Uncharacterized protein n=2 Tax=Achromobacter deleyi TaxID=1353891 RepID=A0A6S7AN39_9BURK|nr:hypothetical protein LMG3458_04581 [Achromobacter deleyi]CAB3918431.1 hypothetical protein LMG3482_05235 [Achromobacter deleyi]CAB3919517.1 hypothetical protein LMG3481_05245 [Achromobacter deleyi]
MDMREDDQMKITAVFPGLPDTAEANLADYAKYFLAYRRTDWEADGCDAQFTCRFEGGEVVLFVVDYFGKGISLRYDCNVPNAKAGSCWYSVGQAEAMQDIVDADTDLYLPLGSCLPPTLAFAVLDDFFTNPLEKSHKVAWVNAEDLDWSSID